MASAVARTVLFGICAAATLAGLVNTYGSEQVEGIAQKTACAMEKACNARPIELSRGAFSHHYKYQMDVDTRRTSSVDCQREYVLVGEWKCKLAAP